MDQNLRNPSCLFLNHTHVGMGQNEATWGLQVLVLDSNCQGNRMLGTCFDHRHLVTDFDLNLLAETDRTFRIREADGQNVRVSLFVPTFKRVYIKYSWEEWLSLIFVMCTRPRAGEWRHLRKTQRSKQSSLDWALRRRPPKKRNDDPPANTNKQSCSAMVSKWCS